jgi:hypothetical protein
VLPGDFFTSVANPDATLLSITLAWFPVLVIFTMVSPLPLMPVIH